MASEGGEKKNAKELIEQNLREIYQEALQQEVPDRFKALLKDLKAADEKNGGSS